MREGIWGTLAIYVATVKDMPAYRNCEMMTGKIAKQRCVYVYNAVVICTMKPRTLIHLRKRGTGTTMTSRSSTVVLN